MMRDVPAHYIRENQNANVPQRVVCIATESVDSHSPGGSQQTWRLGVAVFIHWTRHGNLSREARVYDEPERLWRDIADFTRPKRRTVVYAHNVPYHVRISKALHILPDLNFNLEAIRVANAGSWSRWSRDKATLTICDSSSVFPCTMRTLGSMWGKQLKPRPEGDDREQWVEHCSRSAEVLAATVVSYFDWLRTGVAGNWQMTGAGQSWAHWRHAHYTHKVLVHPDSEALAAERVAMWTGRAEAFQWGRDVDAPIYEWDWQNAYPRIARDCELPYSLSGSVGAVPVSALRQLVQRYAVLAEVSVETDMPVVPARYDGRILWPVGSFDTTLWDPEIDLLLRTGQSVTVKRAWLYKRGPVLQQWGRWVLGELGFEKEGRPPWLGIVLKHWSRALIGRFATQYQNWELFGQDSQSDVRMGHMLDLGSQSLMEFMQVGQKIHTMSGLSESDDSCPQITSYIMSMARNRLYNAMTAIGMSNVYYVDTDSIIVNTAGHYRIRELTDCGKFDGLRLKHSHRGYEIYGPRALVAGDNYVFSGLPSGSRRVGDTSFRGEVTTSMERAIRIGEWDRVTTIARPFNVRWNEHRRPRSDDGRTVAWRLPEHVPERPVGRLPAVTAAERIAALTKQLGGTKQPVRPVALESGVGPGVVRDR